MQAEVWFNHLFFRVSTEVKYVTVGVSDKRPAYADAVSLLVKANQKG